MEKAANEHQKTKKSNIFIPICIAMTLVCIILIGALVFTMLSFESYKKENANSNNIPTMGDDISGENNGIPSDTPETITVDALKEYAAQYNVSAEFLQKFFDDQIVYKSNGGIKYAPIDETLPKSTLDFNNIVQVEGEKQYHENGISVGTKVIDVSKHQGNIDWKKVKASGVDHAIIRLGSRGYGTGKLVLDEQFHTNIKGATAAGIRVGVYFYSQAITVDEAIEEAQMVLDNIKGYNISLPIAFDTEEVDDNPEEVRTSVLNMQARTDIAIAFLDKIKAAGHTPMIYSNIKWFIEALDMKRLVEYDTWFAQYYGAPFFPYDLQMWQYTGKGKVDGIKGDVDLNICFKEY